MSAACLVRLARYRGQHVARSGLLKTGMVPPPFQQDSHLQFTILRRQLYSPSEKRQSNTRFDADSSGHPTTWDSFGIWDNRIDEPILLPPSIRYGKPIPKVSLSRVGCASLIGQRRENEDRFQVSQMTDSILYFAVFDGHGGPEAADFCEKYMEKTIMNLVAEEDNLELVLTKAFLEVDKALAKHLHFSPSVAGINAGTTATVALLRDSIELVVGSVGDSRAMLCRKGKALKLTVDHTPERKDEKERLQKIWTPLDTGIKKSGGFITWNSLGQPNVNNRLAMTRSIGDFDLKSIGVIAEPETKRVLVGLNVDPVPAVKRWYSEKFSFLKRKFKAITSVHLWLFVLQPHKYVCNLRLSMNCVQFKVYKAVFDISVHVLEKLLRGLVQNRTHRTFILARRSNYMHPQREVSSSAPPSSAPRHSSVGQL
ncbi:protein phosphatase Mn(2+)-dependent 1K isoform X1 [Brachyistius frenatus]|uniref:protein phosphatase Mn(2+)-dependent 1K isoform X1 n=1 Tax=Brachyistius frenatus TaxID=100188 RepID=UPI0037E865A4